MPGPTTTEGEERRTVALDQTDASPRRCAATQPLFVGARRTAIVLALSVDCSIKQHLRRVAAHVGAGASRSASPVAILAPSPTRPRSRPRAARPPPPMRAIQCAALWHPTPPVTPSPSTGGGGGAHDGAAAPPRPRHPPRPAAALGARQDQNRGATRAHVRGVAWRPPKAPPPPSLSSMSSHHCWRRRRFGVAPLASAAAAGPGRRKKLWLRGGIDLVPGASLVLV